MKLKSLKLPGKTTDEMLEVAPTGEPSQGPHYPYGTCLDFNRELLEELPSITKIQAGTEVNIVAKGFIKEIRIDETKKPQNVSLQITDIAIAGTESFDESFKEAGKEAEGNG